MKCNFQLLLVGVNCLLSSLFVGRSGAGVGSVQCTDGNYYDRSKNRHVSCSECKNGFEDCFSCCKKSTGYQGERSNTTKVKSHPQSQDAPRKAKLSSSEGADFSPNILVVSTVGFVIGASFLVVLLVVVKSSTVCRHREAAMSDSQEDDIVTEVIDMEPPCNSAEIEQGDIL